MRSLLSVFVSMAFAMAFGACEGATSSSEDDEFAPTVAGQGDPAHLDFGNEPFEIVVDGTVGSVTGEMCVSDPNRVIFGRSFSCTVPETGKVFEMDEVVEVFYVQFMLPGGLIVTSELGTEILNTAVQDEAFLCWDAMPGVPANPSDYSTLWPSVEVPVVCGEGAYTVSISNDVGMCTYFKIGNGGLTGNALAYEFERVGKYDPKLDGNVYADLVLPVDGGEEVTIVVAPIFE